MQIPSNIFALGPEQLSDLGRAFDQAWDEIASQFGYDPEGKDLLKERLASIIICLAHDDRMSPEAVREQAVKVLRRSASAA